MPSSDTWQSQLTLSRESSEGRTRSWVNTPHFGAIAKADKPVNSYGDRQYRVKQTRQLMTRTSAGNPTLTTWNAVPYRNDEAITYAQTSRIATGLDDAMKARMLNSVKLKALVKIADAKVNVAVAYAEASKTSDLILDAARRIHGAYRSFRRGDLRGIAQNLNITPKRLHKSWLEYKYGWMPLLMDVKGAAEFFAQQHVIRPPVFQVSASEEATKAYPWTYTDEAYGGTALKTQTGLYSSHLKVRVKIWCELSSPHLSELQQIGLTNPALVAWELVPFSFVFDWFVQVGDWLTGMTALHGVTVKRAMYSIVEDQAGVRVSPETFNITGTYPNTVTFTDSGYTLVASYRGYDRAAFSPDPLDLYPPVTNSFNFPKLVTSLALIQGLYRGKARNARV